MLPLRSVKSVFYLSLYTSKTEISFENHNYFDIILQLTMYAVPSVVPGAKKVNFVEMRSFLHLFRSFDRMWNFYFMSLQVPDFVEFI